MRLYLIWHHADSHYVATQGDAKAYVKSVPSLDRCNVCIDEVEVETNKENLLRVLNEQGGFQTTLRSWQGSIRGGLKSINKE